MFFGGPVGDRFWEPLGVVFGGQDEVQDRSKTTKNRSKNSCKKMIKKNDAKKVTRDLQASPGWPELGGGLPYSNFLQEGGGPPLEEGGGRIVTPHDHALRASRHGGGYSRYSRYSTYGSKQFSSYLNWCIF